MYERHIKSGKLVPGMNFHQQVWAITARIPKGKVTTYSAIARALGSNACRAVGAALHRNPYAPDVPCHRVVASTRKLQGFAHGILRKRQMLLAEGVRIDKHGRVDRRHMLQMPVA